MPTRPRCGVVLRPLGDVLHWMPPCVDDEQLELLAHTTLAAIDEAIACATRCPIHLALHSGQTVTLPEETANHLVRVMRLRG